jgi:hypothetical protein
MRARSFAVRSLRKPASATCDGGKRNQREEELAESSIASGIFAVVGTLVGAGLKAGGTRTQSQRRANGKVLAELKKAQTECWNIVTQLSEKQDYHTGTDFATRQKRMWDLVDKAAEAEAENVLLLSAGFSKAYWKFYYELKFKGSEQVLPGQRYPAADTVFKKWEPKLQSKARGELWLWLTYTGAMLVAGLAAGAALAAHWAEILAQLPDWLISFLDKLDPA